MHSWGDEGVDWQGISDAAEFIGRNLRKWGRVNVTQYKEKYGTVRVYCSLGWHQVHCITHPGYAYSQYPNWLWYLDCLYLSRIVRYLNWLIIPVHKYMYTWFYGRALRKWPHLRLEILSGADYPELLNRYGVHVVRDSENGYTIHHDWHPDNFQAQKESGE